MEKSSSQKAMMVEWPQNRQINMYSHGECSLKELIYTEKRFSMIISTSFS